MIRLSTEHKYFVAGYESVAGVDEAGRGPLAGPVVAASFLLQPGQKIPKTLAGVADSKRLSPARRQGLYQAIRESGCLFGLGVVEAETIDSLNILRATFLAMRQALGQLPSPVKLVLVDGSLAIAGWSGEQRPIVKGDQTVFSIAAASIIAKVERDRLMAEWHRLYPVYGFDRHKGYGTQDHLRKLRQYGPSPIHRASFVPVRQIKAAC